MDGHDDQRAPTASRALAYESLRPRRWAHGAGRVGHAASEVRDVGWNEEPRRVQRPVVDGLDNDELWALLRRFDRQILHVKRVREPPLANLDMDIADECFSPDKLRTQLERLYMTVGLSLVSSSKHVTRLRSWRQRRRTSAFLAVYAVAWTLDLLMPTLVIFLMTLVLCPRARPLCFPPVPPALVDSGTGGVQKPRAGVLASRNTLTGAPEKHRGEGVEKEARSFVTSLSALVLSVGAGKHPQGDAHADEGFPDPTRVAENTSEARDRSDGANGGALHDGTLSQSVWDRARPTMRLLADLADTWERLGNALTPTQPFPRRRPGLVLAACLVPVLLASCLVTSYALVKGAGFALFGGPAVTPLVALANRTYPYWQKYVELRHSILRGVPTNAQLAMTLLRIGERNKTPLPPPPHSDAPPTAEPDTDVARHLDALGGCPPRGRATVSLLTERGGQTGATDEEKREATMASVEGHSGGEAHEPPTMTRRMVHLVKETARGGIEAALTADRAKAAAGDARTRERLGVVRRASPATATGPVRFPARYGGKRGHAYVTATATAPALSWTPDLQRVDPAWTVAVADLADLAKVGGLVWKSKLAVCWALDKVVVDGLVATTVQDHEHLLTAVVGRDALFNRLIAIGSQMWEAR